MYAIVIVATPFNLQHRNFGRTFLMGFSKKGFLKPEEVGLKFFFVHKSTGVRQKFKTIEKKRF